jgi:hypothetical protein
MEAVADFQKIAPDGSSCTASIHRVPDPVGVVSQRAS